MAGYSSQKMLIPKGVKQVIHKYTPWETMEDIKNAEKKYRDMGYGDLPPGFNIEDLKIELGRMEKLVPELKKYVLSGGDFRKPLHDAVEETKRQFFYNFQGIKNMEAYYEISDEYWADAILIDSPVSDVLESASWCESRPYFSLASLAYGHSPYRPCLSCPPPAVDYYVEIRLRELYQQIAANRRKVFEAYNAYKNSFSVYQRVLDLIKTLKGAVDRCDRKMWGERCRRKRECDRKKQEEAREREQKEQEEARRLVEENLQCLCDLMKEVLGDRVENVVVSSRFGSSCYLTVFPFGSSCYLTDSGKTMEINPNDHIIEDLRQRSKDDKNDVHVRDATLLLFNYAALRYKTKPTASV